MHWTVIGTTWATGVFTSKADLIDRAFGPLRDCLEGPLTTRFVDLAVDGDKVFLSFESVATGRTGGDYAQTYCWAMR